ncbi:MAG TPA: hypothetical protein VM123_18510 [archaeon]|nr:hypothetical protein [archaeon]
MTSLASFLVIVLSLTALFFTSCDKGAQRAGELESIVSPEGASFAESLAAREIRRYLFLRTGKLLPIVEELEGKHGGWIVVGSKGRPLVKNLLADPQLKSSVESLAPGHYCLKTLEHASGRVALVAGGDDLGTLYGAYRLAEHLGVRFYLHGDVVPDSQVAAVLPELDETGRPLFDIRGIQPFHDFPEGPDWWDLDTYKAVCSQLPKLRMNFIGLHTYPEGDVGPEPAVWIGSPEDVGEEGRVKFSYPARHFTTLSGTWGYKPASTGDYIFGAAELFERDDYGADYMVGMAPWPGNPQDCKEMFNRLGAVLREAFNFAHRLGIKTCVGTETPLTIPAPVRERLKAAGRDPSDPAVVELLYEGMFRRIMKAYPLDYYWFWTPEGWTWQGASEEQVKATLADFRAALAAAEKVKAPFTLATCGWVLGPQSDRSLFDNALPKEMPMSCINREVGKEPVEPGFSGITGRPKWAIPWLEDDPALIVPQLWAGRMRRDAADALAYRCTGLLGIHWRTRILGPNIAALAHAAWDQQGWNAGATAQAGQSESEKPRHLPAGDFYADWALYQFGPEAAEPVAAIFTRLDGRLPCPSRWVGGPGGIKPDSLPWEEVGKDYEFVDELAGLRPKIRGAGNSERFDYWLNTFRYLRAVAQVSCAWVHFGMALDKVKAAKDSEARKTLAREFALPARKELVARVEEAHSILLSTVTTTGALGNVANWQQHLLPALLTEPGMELAGILGEDLPEDAMPSRRYDGPARIIVPTVRTSLFYGETLKLKVIFLGAEPGHAAVYWRPMGQGGFAEMPLEHVNRGVYTVTLPSEATREDLEYYIQATTGSGETLRFPAASPALNQTVVVLPAESD